MQEAELQTALWVLLHPVLISLGLELRPLQVQQMPLRLPKLMRLQLLPLRPFPEVAAK